MTALSSIGHQQLTVSTSALSLTVPTGTRPTHALIQCGATNAVRWRADGTDPTSSVGIALAASTVLDLTDPMGDYSSVIAKFRVIRSGGADATLDIEYFN